jgi:serine/threonine-protein kinase
MEQPSWIKRTLGGRYLIEALLGQGGMSAVYKANDPNLKRVIAIKMIHSHLASDSNFIMRFHGARIHSRGNSAGTYEPLEQGQKTIPY